MQPAGVLQMDGYRHYQRRCRELRDARRQLPASEPAPVDWVVLTAAHYQLDVGVLCSPTRTRPLVQARWVAMQLLWAEGMSTPAIARHLGRRDHDCVSSGLAQIADDPELLAVVKRIRAKQGERA